MDGDREDFLLRKIVDLQGQNAALGAENDRLRAERAALTKALARAHRQIEELKAARQPVPMPSPVEDPAADPSPPPPPAWVKPDVRGRRRKRPGRKKGHPAALRPPPAKVDQHVDVPLPRD